ncbi:facilitated trehalose transporter Tret1-2 homolog [Eurytemora carolleeae]|uniref:facilitated trehalose transporter Tret1-2 homolog n=1 Tax=Eurytemora carolleeae TaxID=1294199 RepID=UPI000C7830E5|nr:facilitated trehalose transporter Tret1-2 homolog [Eurytemora carolleeae]|eukprot:XP_023323438.1 facilitated trehalose transporter Tret1-2 homolog [Eurytemora affinis]
MDKFGRRKTLLVFTSGLYLSGFILILLATAPAMVLIGRFLNGMGLGFVLAVSSIYIVEIATTDLRGFLGCFVQFLGSIGVLIIFSAGCFLNWFQLAGLMIVMVVPFVIGMYICPESPRWLYSKGLEDEGRTALEWLRGTDSPQALQAEIRAIKLEQVKKKKNTVSVKVLGEASILKPFLISIFMMFFLNLSGMTVMIFYCNSIFMYSRANISSNLGSVVVGLVLLVSCVAAIFFITRMGRRVILIASMSGMTVCYFLLGGCFYAIESANVEISKAQGSPDMVVDPLENFPGWLPPLAILVLLFLGNGGYGTLIWVVTAELLPPHVRSIGNSIIICFSFIMGFIVSKTFVDLIMAIGASGTFWLYASICGAGTIYTIFLVPETKGKTVEQIAQMFKKN